MKFDFTIEEQKVIKDLMPDIEPDTDMSDEEYFRLDGLVVDALMEKGFVGQRDVTEYGKICESIIDKLSAA